jgi:uncharacterized protein (TIGR03089 family)
MSQLPGPLDLLLHRMNQPRPLLVDLGPAPARIELSGRVVANWWAKNLGLLQSEFDVGPGTVVELRCAASWRSVPLALAALTLGATLTEHFTDPADADLVIADELDDEVLDAPEVLAVATAPHALDFGAPLPAGVVDHAAEVRGHPDQPVVDATSAAHCRLGLESGQGPTADLATLAQSVAEARTRLERVGGADHVAAVPKQRGVLHAVVQVLASGESGHVVLHDGDSLAPEAAAQEGVTARAD